MSKHCNNTAGAIRKKSLQP